MRLLSFSLEKKFSHMVYTHIWLFSSDCAPDFWQQSACKLSEFCDESQRMREVVVVVQTSSAIISINVL